jgi:hypothetical protein
MTTLKLCLLGIARYISCYQNCIDLRYHRSELETEKYKSQGTSRNSSSPVFHLNLELEMAQLARIRIMNFRVCIQPHTYWIVELVRYILSLLDTWQKQSSTYARARESAGGTIDCLPGGLFSLPRATS